MVAKRAEIEDIVAVYRDTGSVWKTAQKIGISGQTVHARLRSAGHKVGSGWEPEEIDRLHELANTATIGQIADEFGRSYASVACKINELGIGARHGNRVKRKLPRGAGFDKVSVKRHLRVLEDTKIPITRYARQHGIVVDTLIRAIEEHYPEWWINYRNGISDLPSATCPECQNMFYPSNARQKFCTRVCQGRYRVDQNYFGGNRSSTIGLKENICQICGRSPKKGMSSHHVIGKENDDDNEFLVALCSGCHDLVTSLGARNFTPDQWQSLISFAWLRRHGTNLPTETNVLHVTVDIDLYLDEDFYETDDSDPDQMGLPWPTTK